MRLRQHLRKAYFQRVQDASEALLNESQPNRERLEQRIVALDDQVEQLTDGLAEKQNAEAEIHRYTQPLPKLPDINTFRD